MIRYCCPLRSISMSMASRVVPEIGETTARSSAASRFSSDDLPTFGRPMMAMRIGPLSSSSISIAESAGTISPMMSNSSSIPSPCSADSGSIRSKPSS